MSIDYAQVVAPTHPPKLVLPQRPIDSTISTQFPCLDTKLQPLQTVPDSPEGMGY
jgi:hypothetical protein